VYLYECETWSLTLREEHRLRVFENRVLMRIFTPKKNEKIGNWRKLNNEELRNLHSAKQVEEHEMDRTCSTNESEEECT
jgi:hypothetical protein